jgi:hypothetical protein
MPSLDTSRHSLWKPDGLDNDIFKDCLLFNEAAFAIFKELQTKKIGIAAFTYSKFS